MTSPAPAPELGGGEATPPPLPSLSPPAPSPEIHDVSPPLAPVVPTPVPSPPPPESSSSGGGISPPPLAPPPQPPVAPPPSPPPPTPVSSQPPLPTPLISPPPTTNRSPNPTTAPSPSPPQEPPPNLPRPSFRRPKTTPPATTPPVALPVPQAPGGGAWLPSTSDPPSPLPSLPESPGVISSPATPLIGNTNGTSTSGNYHQNIEGGSASGRSNGSSGFVVGLCVGGILLLLLGAIFAILFVFCRKKHKKFDHHGSERKHGTPWSGFEDTTTSVVPQYTKQGSNNSRLQVLIHATTPQAPYPNTSGPGPGGGGPSSGTFTYEELARATNGFSELNLLGQGGFGYVYKGRLPNGKEVAVKQLKMGGHQGEREFQAEVETISQVHHKHLVSLVGYCIAGVERLLVYEFLANNTLEFHLHGKGQPIMDWPTRLKIAIGSAKGLAYLHEDCSPTIIHRDIKAANILLDFNFEAKVSDFGLAKIFSSTNSSVTHITTRVVGTFGYLAPEYASSGKVTDKSDVYSYGVMLLELITGRPPISNSENATNGSLVNWARPLLTQAIGDGSYDILADPQLQNNYNVEEMANMVACAAACVRLSAWRRPRMSQVVRALEGNLSSSELDDGVRPGHSSTHFRYERLMENFERMTLTSNTSSRNMTSEYTSEYGVHPSASTTDTSQQSNQRG